MRQVNIREFRMNMAGELGDLPFELMRNGKPIARILLPSDIQPLIDETHKTIEKMKKKVGMSKKSASGIKKTQEGAEKAQAEFDIVQWANPLDNSILAPKGEKDKKGKP